MPSGVSHGSAPPTGSVRVAFSNAIFAKFGMRLISMVSFVMAGLVPAIHVLSFNEGKTWMPGTSPGMTGLDAAYHNRSSASCYRRPSIMVRMLVADDAAQLVRTVVLQGGLARHVRDRYHPAEPGFGAELLGRYHPVRAVERAGHDLDPRPVDAAKAQRGAAIPAEIAHRDGRGAERGRLAAGPGEIAIFNVGEGRERRAGRLLAHPAMTDADLHRRRRHRKANRAALAAAGQNGFGRRCHVNSINPKASCSVARASPPAKMKS